jgi:hypothetical protein
MTWVEWAVIALLVDLFWRVGLAVVRVACIVAESVRGWPRIPPDPRKANPRRQDFTVPNVVAVQSDEPVSLDYSSGPKRH